MKTTQEIAAIIAALKELYPDAACSLDYGKDYELLFSVRLAAQCTDARVNLVTPALFQRYPTLEAFADADVDEVGRCVQSCGFWRAKARDIVAAAQQLLARFGGKVPDNMEDLLTLPGVKMEDITEIYSHQQALSQCEQYLQAFPDVKVIPCENTAVAAQKVAEGDGHAAALSSRSCMKLYGLECLEAGVQDQGSNFTRFICISKNLEIYPGADRTSLMAVLPHEPGSLCRVLSRFYALGLNLNKLESRPMPERNFEFMFYFDLETPVYAPEFLQLMGELPSLCEEFSYLGSYSEVV